MNNRKWIIFGVSCLIIFGIIITTNKQKEVVFSGDAKQIITDGPIADRVTGSTDKKVVLLEYADYQCPACSKMQTSTKNILAKYPQVTYVFRNLPLTNIHPNALAAATAAEAAGQQNKYFEMHDKLYENQSSWSSSNIKDRSAIFEGYAKSIGLDVVKFTNDLASADVTAKIARDRTTAKQFDINSTPTFLINGNKLPETTSINGTELEAAIKESLQNAGYSL